MTNKRFKLAYEKGNWWAVQDNGVTLWKEEVVDMLNQLYGENIELKSSKDKVKFEEEDFLVDKFNWIYNKYGFGGILDEVSDMLEYGGIKEIESDLYRITTGGWSDDETLIHALIAPHSLFHYHYVGYIVGGAFYFHKDKEAQCKLMRTN